MKKVDVMFFDLDGTLVDSKKDVILSLNYVSDKMGIGRKDERDILSYIGIGRNDLIRKAFNNESDYTIKRALDLFGRYYDEHYLDNVKLYKDTIKILELYKDKYKVILTNRRFHTSKAIIEHLGLAKYFNIILGGDDHKKKKPCSDTIIKIMDKLSVRKDRAVMIGDLDIDIIAGNNAGIITCGVTYGIGDVQKIKEAEPDYMIDNLYHLKQIFE